jgi:hypothetical protein
MKRKRKCHKCRESFLPDPRSCRPTKENPEIRISPQHFCSKPECQRESHRQSHRAHVRKNPGYRAKQLMSARRWRKKNGDYWRHRRSDDPKIAKRNRVLQRQRDAKAKGNLANINSIGAVHREKLSRIGLLIDLANINPIEVPWTVVSEEIVALLRWSSRLANIKPIGSRRRNQSQSHA